MYLKYFDCGSHTNNNSTKEFIIFTYSLTSLYLKKLGDRYNTVQFVKIRIDFHENIKEKSELPEKSINNLTNIERKQRFVEGNYFYQNMIETLLDVVIIHRHFDFNNFFKQNTYTKRLLILNELHKGAKKIAKHFGWDIKPLDEAYNKCIEAKLENNWISKKLKTKSSPNRKHKAAVYFEYNSTEIRVYQIIYNKNGKQLQKTHVFTLDGLDNNIMYPDDIMPIVNGKTKWIKDEFILYDKKNNEIGRTKVNETTIEYLNEKPTSMVAEPGKKYSSL